MNEFKIIDNKLYLNGRIFSEYCSGRYLHSTQIDIGKNINVVLNVLHESEQLVNIEGCSSLEIFRDDFSVLEIFEDILVRYIYDPAQVEFIWSYKNEN